MITLFTEKLFLSLSVKKSCKVVKFLIKQLNFGDFLRPTMYIVERFQLMVDVFVTRCSCGTGETSVYQGTSRNVIFVHLKLTKYIILFFDVSSSNSSISRKLIVVVWRHLLDEITVLPAAQHRPQARSQTGT